MFGLLFYILSPSLSLYVFIAILGSTNVSRTSVMPMFAFRQTSIDNYALRRGCDSEWLSVCCPNSM